MDRRITSFAVVFAAVFGCARLLILYFSELDLTSARITGLLLGLTMEVVIGALLGYLLIRDRPWFGVILLTVVTAVKLGAFHYESFFGYLPGADIFYYVRELPILLVSLAADARLIGFMLQVVSVVCLLLLFARYSKSKPENLFIRRILVSIIVSGIFIQFFPSLLPQSVSLASREPLSWLLQSYVLKKQAYQLSEVKDADKFIRYHGLSGVVRDKNYPTCLAPSSLAASINQKNINQKTIDRKVVLVVLEGVGVAEMNMVRAGHEVMPNLRRIANENFMFNRIVSTGTKSVQSLPAIYSGLPANPHANILWNSPLLTYAGFPQELQKRGYATAYFHGGDLAFENQRRYLQEIGFQQIESYHPKLPYPVYGWGYDDATMFGRLKKWLEQAPENTPVFAAIATLSSHHPFVLPDDWSPLFSKKDQKIDFIGWRNTGDEQNLQANFFESYRYMDYQLGQFYDWYRSHYPEALLLITSDHPSNELFLPKESDFLIPLIISGLSDQQLLTAKSKSSVLGSQYDIPATLMALLGGQPHECGLGINLLSMQEPENRYVYAVSGNELQTLTAWHNDEVITLNRHLSSSDASISSEQGSIHLPYERLPDALKAFFESIIPTHYYLWQQDRYFKGDMTDVTGAVASAPEIKIVPPIFVSHRGNLLGPGEAENSRQALQQVVASDFEWVEMDIQITRDGVLVLSHDNEIQSKGESYHIDTLSLAELQALDGYQSTLSLESAIKSFASELNLLIEVKPTSHITMQLHMIREIVRIIKDYELADRVIVDSFNQFVAESIKFQCQCVVGYDTPYRQPLSDQELEDIRNMQIDWIYVHFDVFDQDLLARAHAHGLKVMVYTVNSKRLLRSWRDYFPDGIITDNVTQIEHYQSVVE